MSRKRLKGTAEVLDVIRHNPSRGQAFWFLHANHDEILAQSQVGHIPWRAVLEKLQELGLTDGNGNPVTNTGTLRKTWSRVCDLKRREAEAKRQRAAERKRPTNDPPPVVARTVAPAPAPAPAYQPPSGSAPFQIKTVPRAVVEEEARLAYERRPDLFPRGPDVLRYKILKESGKRL